MRNCGFFVVVLACGGSKTKLPLGAQCTKDIDCAIRCTNGMCEGGESSSTPPEQQMPAPETLSVTADKRLLFAGTTTTVHAFHADTSAAEVSWSASAGSVTSAGLFTAPSAPGDVTVTASGASGAMGSTTIAVVAATPPAVTAQNGDHTITLSWVSVPGADSYVVARSNSPSGPFTDVQELLTNEYSDTSLPYGQQYYYQVSSRAGVQSPPSPPVKGVSISGTEVCAIDTAADGFFVFDGMQNGNFPPLRSLVNRTALQRVIDLAMDEDRGELFVLQQNEQIGYQVLVFAIDASGNTAPIRKFTVAASGVTPLALTVDIGHSQIFIGVDSSAHTTNRVDVYAEDATGSSAPARSVSLGDYIPLHLAYDPVHSEVAMAAKKNSDQTLHVMSFPVGGADLSGGRNLQVATAGNGIAVNSTTGEIYRAATNGSVQINRYARSGGATFVETAVGSPIPSASADVIAIDAAHDEAILGHHEVLTGSGTIRVVNLTSHVARTIAGPQAAITGVVKNMQARSNGEIFWLSESPRSLQAFSRSVFTGTQDQAPTRVVRGPFGSALKHMAIDRTHREIYTTADASPDIQVFSLDTLEALRTLVSPSGVIPSQIIYDPFHDRILAQNSVAFDAGNFIWKVNAFARPLSSGSITPAFSVQVYGTNFGMQLGPSGDTFYYGEYYTDIGTYGATGANGPAPKHEFWDNDIEVTLGVYYNAGEFFLPAQSGNTVYVYPVGASGESSYSRTLTVPGVSDAVSSMAFSPALGMLITADATILSFAANATGAITAARTIGGAATALNVVAEIAVCK